MIHVWLLTALPPRPERPGRPALPRDEVVERCTSELGERHRLAVQALCALYDPSLAAADEDAWRRRYEDAQRAAEEARAEVLVQWLRYDRALREALAARRAEGRGLPRQTLRPDVADAAERMQPLLAEAERAPDPRSRERVLDTARLQELNRLAGIDPFGTDAVLAHIAAALVVDRWDFPEDDE